jgi:hypothetical protein
MSYEEPLARFGGGAAVGKLQSGESLNDAAARHGAGTALRALHGG